MVNGIRSSISWFRDVMVHSFLFSGLLLLNMLLGAIVIALIEFRFSPEIASIQVYNPDGIYWIVAVALVTTGLAVSIEKFSGVRRFFEPIPRYTWDYVSAENPRDLSSEELTEYREKKDIYVSQTVRILPLLLVGLSVPFLIPYMYTKPLNFSIVSVLLLIIGIIIGSFGTLFGKKMVTSSNEALYEQEIGEITTRQLEGVLFLCAALTQIIGSFGIRLNELNSILLGFFFAFIMVGPAFVVYFRNSL